MQLTSKKLKQLIKEQISANQALELIRDKAYNRANEKEWELVARDLIRKLYDELDPRENAVVFQYAYEQGLMDLLLTRHFTAPNRWVRVDQLTLQPSDSKKFQEFKIIRKGNKSVTIEGTTPAAPDGRTVRKLSVKDLTPMGFLKNYRPEWVAFSYRGR